MTTHNSKRRYTRRKVLYQMGLATGAMALPSVLNAATSTNPHRVILVKTEDRVVGMRQALDLLQPSTMKGKRIFLKPNYNTGDPAPAATDTRLLEALVQDLQGDGAGQITVGDRSGMANTRQAMQRKGVFRLADRYGFKAIVFDEMGRGDWQYFPQGKTNWSRGFAIARPVLNADAIVNTCCLKTHRFGGHFTLSLKNTIGMVARYVPGDAHDYMRELHASPNQRLMIAEVNMVYRPSLVLVDGVEAFVGGGPERGRVAKPGVILAGTDRIAVDAVGIAILRSLGTTNEVARGSIWNMAQIRRAADLGLGAINAQQVELVTGDQASTQMANRIRQFLVS
ncbi:MAG: DUF362 domain-containing protein [Cyanothece sp. SIO1E1]|nr:DUF362 domain-containing protein [Cyanothece sp. SIO1E1]